MVGYNLRKSKSKVFDLLEFPTQFLQGHIQGEGRPMPCAWVGGGDSLLIGC